MEKRSEHNRESDRKKNKTGDKKREEAKITQMLASPGNIVTTELSSRIAFDVQLF